VTLRIDTARALRSHDNHLELVKSIVAAPPGGSGWSFMIDKRRGTS
jgi:hypothetical protein